MRSKDTKRIGEVSGLGKLDRERLGKTLRRSRGILSVKDAVEAIGLDATRSAKLLSRWAKKGWLSRVCRGLYVPIALESRTTDVPLEDPWEVAQKIYSPCYIGGWSAAEYWELTEQIFRSVVVLTTRRPRVRQPVLRGTPFLIKTVSRNAFFGLKTVWRRTVKVDVSNEARTVVDMLDDPRLSGGIRPTADVLGAYLRSKSKDLDAVLRCADRLGNGAVFKRLGFLLERAAPNEKETIERCRTKMSKGNSQLDPGDRGKRLVTRWRLWVSENWTKRAAA